jgi:hypothetical protein
MELDEELKYIKNSIDSAIGQQKEQLISIDRITLRFSIVSITSFIGTDWLTDIPKQASSLGSNSVYIVVSIYYVG